MKRATEQNIFVLLIKIYEACVENGPLFLEQHHTPRNTGM